MSLMSLLSLESLIDLSWRKTPATATLISEPERRHPPTLSESNLRCSRPFLPSLPREGAKG
jgi:hypothetical protein